MRRRGVERFARWGLIHGPAWGLVAAAVAGVTASGPVFASGGGLGESLLVTIMAGAVGGALVGPALGAVVGLACLAADRLPKWLLDAPDYVAVGTVLLSVGLVAWPLLELGRGGLLLGVLAVALVAAAPAVDAARSAEALLHPPVHGPVDA